MGPELPVAHPRPIKIWETRVLPIYNLLHDMCCEENKCWKVIYNLLQDVCSETECDH